MKRTKKFNNVKDVRDEILNIMSELRSGKLPLEVAKTVINAAGKATSNAVAEMNYYKFIGERRKIDFFEVPQSEIITK
jgi:hypothetical protein